MLRPYNLNNNSNIKPTTKTRLEEQPLEGPDKLDLQQHSQERTAVGHLIRASLDRPELMFAAKLHSRLQGSTTQDCKSLKHTFRSIKGGQDYELFIGKCLPNINGTVTPPQHNIPLELKLETRLRSGVVQDGCVLYSISSPPSHASRTQLQ